MSTDNYGVNIFPLLPRAIAAATAVMCIATAASPAAASTVIPMPPLPADDGTTAMVPRTPSGGGAWNGDFSVDNNLPAITSFVTSMGPVESQIAAEALEVLNAERAARGLDPLVWNEPGTTYATALAHRNAAVGQNFHSNEIGTASLETLIPGSTTGARLPSPTGENVLSGNGTSTASDMIRDFMFSDAHRSSLMGGGQNAVAIGVACQNIVAIPATGQTMMTYKMVIMPMKSVAAPDPGLADYDPAQDAPHPQGFPAPAGTVTQAGVGTNCKSALGTQTTVAAAGSLDEVISAVDYTAADADTLRLYRAFFDRDPDLAGVKYWISQARAGASYDEMAWGFANSDEFTNTYGNTNTADFLTIVYTNVLGRTPDAGGYNYWLGEMTTGGLARHAAVRWVAASDEFSNRHPYMP